MNNIKSPRLLWIKGGLFVLLGLLALGLVVILSGNFSVFVATVIAIWAFCRAYYFAFYVIQHYIDSRFRFAGLTSAFHFWMQEKLPVDTESSPVESYVDVPAGNLSRWSAIQFWMILILSPVLYWGLSEWIDFHRFRQDGFWMAAECVLASAWLGLLAFWTAHGSLSHIWRILIGFSLAYFACYLFSMFVTPVGELWRSGVTGPLNLTIFAAGVIYFLSAVGVQCTMGIMVRSKLADQLRPVSTNKIEWQIGTRFLLCLMAIIAFATIISIRAFGFWEYLDGQEYWLACRVVTSAILSAILTHLTATMILSSKGQPNAKGFLLILCCLFISPVIIAVPMNMQLTYGFFSWSTIRLDVAINGMALLGYCFIQAMVFYFLRSTGVHLQSKKSHPATR